MVLVLDESSMADVSGLVTFRGELDQAMSPV